MLLGRTLVRFCRQTRRATVAALVYYVALGVSPVGAAEGDDTTTTAISPSNSQSPEEGLGLSEVFGYGAGLIGIVGVYWTYQSKRNQDASSLAYRTILENADEFGRAKLTREELDRLEEQTAALRIEVPRLAQREFLTQQRSQVASSIEKLASEYAAIEKRLHFLGVSEHPLPPTVEAIIRYESFGSRAANRSRLIRDGALLLGGLFLVQGLIRFQFESSISNLGSELGIPLNTNDVSAYLAGVVMAVAAGSLAEASWQIGSRVSRRTLVGGLAIALAGGTGLVSAALVTLHALAETSFDRAARWAVCLNILSLLFFGIAAVFGLGLRRAAPRRPENVSRSGERETQLR